MVKFALMKYDQPVQTEFARRLEGGRQGDIIFHESPEKGEIHPFFGFFLQHLTNYQKFFASLQPISVVGDTVTFVCSPSDFLFPPTRGELLSN